MVIAQRLVSVIPCKPHLQKIFFNANINLKRRSSALQSHCNARPRRARSSRRHCVGSGVEYESSRHSNHRLSRHYAPQGKTSTRRALTPYTSRPLPLSASASFSCTKDSTRHASNDTYSASHSPRQFPPLLRTSASQGCVALTCISFIELSFLRSPSTLLYND